MEGKLFQFTLKGLLEAVAYFAVVFACWRMYLIDYPGCPFALKMALLSTPLVLAGMYCGACVIIDKPRHGVTALLIVTGTVCSIFAVEVLSNLIANLGY